MSIIGVTRGVLAAACVTVLVACIGLSLVARLSDAVVIQGRSMEPAIPRGALVTLDSSGVHRARVGDVVTVRAENGVLVTHRVVRILDLTDGRFLELRGDVNATSDPVLVPLGSAVGRVETIVPYAGYLVALLSTPLGLLSVTSLVGAATLAIRFLDDTEDARHVVAPA